MDAKHEKPVRSASDDDYDLLLVIGPLLAVAIAGGIWLFFELIQLIRILSTPAIW